MDKQITFIDFFAGIGGFRRGMELAGHKCVGFCEFDKNAVYSYMAMHLLTECQWEALNNIHAPVKKNGTLNFNKRQKYLQSLIGDKNINGEWYANDIRTVSTEDIPRADMWCFGAPCQSFSVAGKRAGLEGESGLVREIFRLLDEYKEEDRPEWLIYENVKGMLSSNRGLDYLSILSEMDRLGYDIEWQNINSKWFVSQNRERIYTIGHLRRFGSRKVFPIEGADGENSIQQLGSRIAEKENPNAYRVYSVDGLSPCLGKMQGGGREPSAVLPINVKCININDKNGKERSQQDRVYAIDGDMTALNSSLGGQHNIAIPVLTPDRAEKHQNGRRFKENGDPMFTLTEQDRHGVGVEVLGGLYTNSSSNYNRGVLDGISRTLKADSHPAGVALGIIDPQGRIKKEVSLKNICPTLRSETHGNLPDVCVDVSGNVQKQSDGIFVEMPEGFMVYAVWYEKKQCYIAIRRLTPKECFRLQGWTDDYFERAAFVNSDSQLYKQAGNGVTVSVVEAIAENMKK